MSSRYTMALLCILLVVLPVFGADEPLPTDTVQPTPTTTDASSIPSDSSFNGSVEGWPLAPSSDGLLEGMATSDGFFSLSYLPDFSFGKVSVQLDVKIKGNYTTNPFGVSLDFSDYSPPEKQAGTSTSEYATLLAKHFSRFVRSIQYGDRYENLYIRYGKLLGITLGDGALINGYFDRAVPSRTSRPGLDLMVDGQLIGIRDAGFEFITNDVFSPTLNAWRIFARPLSEYTQYKTLSSLQVGLSYAWDPNPSKETGMATLDRSLFALDVSLPLATQPFFNLDFFSNLLAQSPDSTTLQPAFAYRYGIWGHIKSFFVFNTSVTVPVFGSYYADYFSSDFESRTQQMLDALQVDLGTSRLDALFSLNFVRQGVYLRAKMTGLSTQGVYHDYHFTANVRIDKRLFNIMALDLTYEKLYPSSTGEGFFEGLQTLCNVVVSASAVVKMKPYSFDLGLNVVFDEKAEATFTLDTAVRIAIL